MTNNKTMLGMPDSNTSLLDQFEREEARSALTQQQQEEQHERYLSEMNSLLAFYENHPREFLDAYFEACVDEDIHNLLMEVCKLENQAKEKKILIEDFFSRVSGLLIAARKVAGKYTLKIEEIHP